MEKRNILLLTGLLLALSSFAKSKLRIKTNLDSNYVLYWMPLGASSKVIELPVKQDGTVEWEIEEEQPVILKIGFMPKNRSRQLPANFPLYIVPGKTQKLELHFDTKYRPAYVKGTADKSSKALMDYASWLNFQQYALWQNPPAADSVTIRCQEFLDYADKLLSSARLPDMCKRYLRIWSYAAYMDALGTVGKRNATWSAGKATADYAITPAIWKHTDDELSRYFPNLRFYMLKLLRVEMETKAPFKSVQEAGLLCETIGKKIQQPDWKKELVESVLNGYIENDYHPEYATEETKTLFRELVAKYVDAQKGEDLLQFFASRSYAVTGVAAPDLAFKDVAGRPVKLSQFRDSLVYIDLWASWCVPCIKEIPALQAMEAKFKGRKIVFVSISLDENKQAWRNKMHELDLHGIQWEVGDSGFDKMMNIKSIPRFLLYSADGKLISANAPRPGAAELEQLLEKHLK